MVAQGLLVDLGLDVDGWRFGGQDITERSVYEYLKKAERRPSGLDQNFLRLGPPSHPFFKNTENLPVSHSRWAV